QWEHLRMRDAPPSRHPLYVPVSITGDGSQRIRMVDEATSRHSDGFEATMRVPRKTRHPLPMVHSPAILACKVAADASARERCSGPERLISCWISIVVMHAKQEWVEGLPRGSP